MKFTTGEIITAGLGRLCCPMKDLYKVMNFLTGENLFTHQLPRAFHACTKWVQEQHPWLAQLDLSKCNKDTVHEWLSDAESKHGKQHELNPLPKDQWHFIDPIQEAIDLTGDKNKVITVIK